MSSILILGCGMVGSTVAIDLAKDRTGDLRIADRDEGALRRAQSRVREITGTDIETIPVDLSLPQEVSSLARDAYLVFGALPSAIGYRSLHAVIEAGANCIDISFMPESALELDEVAKARGVTAVFDCGVAPGLSNILGAHGAALLDRCDSIEIYVGGIPKHPKPPFYYKAAFAPQDVIEEYTRPARQVEDSRVVTREALSEPQSITFDGVGELIAVNTDGLRSMIDTMRVPNMTEKTLRWPGHVELMRTLRQIGLFSPEPLKVGDTTVRPVDLTAELLFPQWTYEQGEADLTVMRITAAGEKDGAPARLRWDLYDEYDPVERCSSMSRTTAFPATIIGRMLLAGELEPIGPGVIPPERLAGLPGFTHRLLASLEQRGVAVRANPAVSSPAGMSEI